MSNGRQQHPVEIDKMDEVLEELQDKSVKELLIDILLELKKLNIQAETITDEETEDDY